VINDAAVEINRGLIADAPLFPSRRIAASRRGDAEADEARWNGESHVGKATSPLGKRDGAPGETRVREVGLVKSEPLERERSLYREVVIRSNDLASHPIRARPSTVLSFSPAFAHFYFSLSLSLSLYLFVPPPPPLPRASHGKRPHLRAEAPPLARRARAPRVSNERLNSRPPPPPAAAAAAATARGFPRSHSFPRVSPGSVIFGTFENAVVPATETPDPRGNSDAQAVTPTLRSSDAIHIPAVIANVCSRDPAGKVRSRGRMSAAF